MEISNAFFNIESIIFIDSDSREEIKKYAINLKPWRSPVVIPKIGEKVYFYKNNDGTINFNRGYIVRDVIHSYTIQPVNKDPEILEFDTVDIYVWCEKEKEE